MSEKTRAIMSVTLKGKYESNETRTKMMLAQVKNRKKVYCMESGEIFESLKMAAECYGIGSGEISSVCHRKFIYT